MTVDLYPIILVPNEDSTNMQIPSTKAVQRLWRWICSSRRRRSSTRQNSTPTRGRLNSDRVDLTPTKREFHPTGKMLNCYGLGVEFCRVELRLRREEQIQRQRRMVQRPPNNKTFLPFHFGTSRRKTWLGALEELTRLRMRRPTTQCFAFDAIEVSTRYRRQSINCAECQPRHRKKLLVARKLSISMEWDVELVEFFASFCKTVEWFIFVDFTLKSLRVKVLQCFPIALNTRAFMLVYSGSLWQLNDGIYRPK